MIQGIYSNQHKRREVQMLQKTSKSARQKSRGVDAILDSRSIQKAAAMLHINKQIIYHWLMDSDFCAELVIGAWPDTTDGRTKSIKKVDPILEITLHILKDNGLPPQTRLNVTRNIINAMIHEIQTELRLTETEKQCLKNRSTSGSIDLC
jgi:hypothetical protein